MVKRDRACRRSLRRRGSEPSHFVGRGRQGSLTRKFLRNGHQARTDRRSVPSFMHEVLLQLFRNRPDLALELLREALRLELPMYTEARIESADFSQLAPTGYHADLVVLLGDDVNDAPVLGIVVEVQLTPKPRKRFTWPLYLTALRAKLECDTCVLVIAPTIDVARWAAEPIAIGFNSVVAPLVVGPGGVPIVTDVERATRAPELAVLSVMAHGQGDVDT